MVGCHGHILQLSAWRFMISMLPRTVIVLGLVSLLNDTASEMIFPLLPLFITATLGADPVALGLIEGVAEAASSILKLVAGRMADRGWNHKRMVIAGYATSNAARPLIGLALGWWSVLALRFLDRVGKGWRTSPRDAVISASVADDVRGRAFGFHRSMDHAGAMLGPLIAFVLLKSGMEMREVFLTSVIPGMLLLLLLAWRLPSTPSVSTPVVQLQWSALHPRMRALILAAGGLAFAAVPEAFLILWAYHGGVEMEVVPLLWAAAHGAKSLAAGPAGMFSDRVGRVPVLVMAWTCRIGLLICMAMLTHHGLMVWGLFILYAAALAMSEASERALIGDVAAVNMKATAFGLYHLTSGLAALPGAVLFGLVWQFASMSAALLMSATLTVVAIVFFIMLTH